MPAGGFRVLGGRVELPVGSPVAVEGDAAGDYVLGSAVEGDSHPRWLLTAAGAVYTGDGQSAPVAEQRNPQKFTGAADPASAALRVQGAPSTHLLIANRTGGAPSNGNVLLVTGNDFSDAGPMDTTLGVSGYETGKGTIKVSHIRPVAGGSIDDASASALSIRCNGVGTKAQGIFFDAEDVGGTLGKLLNFRQEGTTVFAVGPNGDIVQGGYNANDEDVYRAAAPVQTMNELLAQGGGAVTSGQLIAAVAMCRAAGSYSTLRFITNGTTPAALTDLKLCVWNAAGALLGATPSIHASVTAANTIYSGTLGSPVALTRDQMVYLGLAWVGTTLGVRGASLIGALTATRTGRTFQTAKAIAGYAGGTPGSLTSGSSGVVPWVELLT